MIARHIYTLFTYTLIINSQVITCHRRSNKRNQRWRLVMDDEEKRAYEAAKEATSNSKSLALQQATGLSTLMAKAEIKAKANESERAYLEALNSMPSD